jgi:hypothetical protein
MLETLYLDLEKKIKKLKKLLLNHVDDFLDNLNTHEGRIVRDVKEISKFQTSMESFFNKHGVEYLAYMSTMIDKILLKSADNFKEDGAKVEDVAYIKELLGIKQGKIAKKRNGQYTVLYALASMMIIEYEIIQKIQQAFLSETKIKDFKAAIQASTSRKFHDFFEVNTVALLFNTYNAANYHFAKEYKYNKFRYEGGLIADSRDFCVERDGQEFWIYQGEEWNGYDWKGKIPGVDFFVQAGGYNCRHWIVYIKK